jgi:hypothetical protein
VIELGGDEELGVREAAKLAGRVREYAGSLVKVRRVLFILSVVNDPAKVGTRGRSYDERNRRSCT